jgi:NADPH:quinone reductase-like Zn-dependent oxidoreductase
VYLLAAMRCNIPTIFVSGGPMKAGVTRSGKVVDMITVFEGVAAYKLGNLHDGRFSGGTRGATVGYVTSEAAGGTYAEFVTMAANAVAPMPRNIGFAAASTVPLAGLTAWKSLFDAAKLSAGQKVLVHAGADGVGSLAIQFAKHAGATAY